MTKKSYPGSLQLTEGGKDEVIKALGVSLKIYKGVLRNRSQFIVEISDINGTDQVYYKYAELMSEYSKKTVQITDDLRNQFGLGRNCLTKTQNEVENLMQQNEYEIIDECKTRLYLGIYGNELEQEEALSREVIEKHYNNVIEYIRENTEFFPQRNLSKDIAPNEGYIPKMSLGVYIADEKGLADYGEEVVAISRQCVQDLITKNTTEFSNIVKRFMELGYFLDSTTNSGDLKQIKLRYGVRSQRMYLVRVKDEIQGDMYHENA